MMKKFIEIKEFIPTLERAIARFGGIHNLSDFRVHLRISEEISWFHPIASDRQLDLVNQYINHLKNISNHE